MDLPTFNDILAASDRIAHVAVRTPLLRSPVLDDLTGGTVLLKAENLQRTGSFKFRGAYNKISQLPKGTRAVVAYSSGNHAQGVAAAAGLLGLKTTIVMPSDAPRMKRSRVEALGGTVVEYDRASEDRAAIAQAIADETGAVIVPPFDDPQIVAGQGTIGLEIVEDVRAMGFTPDQVLVNCSGGGLVAGIGLAVKSRLSEAQVWGVEPEGFDDTARSLAAGRRLANERTSGSVCDALMSNIPGELTFAMNRTQLAGCLTVSDDEALAAVAFGFRDLKLVLEPGGAAALATVLNRRTETRGRTTVVVLSGGNIDVETFSRAVSGW